MDFSAMSAVLQRSAVVFLVNSAVIFVHELGHFLAARWAGVLVERFSIGLGPVLLSRRWGDTEYVLSAIPLGGYVKMLGQTDTPEVEEVNLDPRSYQSKSVGWRMIIISAGVIMNIIFGFALFASAYSLGVPYVPGVIGGHCVMPNVEILRSLKDTALLRAIGESNEQKIARDRHMENGSGGTGTRRNQQNGSSRQ